MNRQNTSSPLFWGLLAVPVLWGAVLLAGCYQEGSGLLDWLGSFTEALNHPFAIRWNEKTLPVLCMALACYGAAVASYYAWRGNRRPGEEHGSAQWGNPKQLNAKYRDRKHPGNNIILTQNVQIGMDVHRHRRNLNTLVVGGSGAGKTRFFCKPGIMSCNCSYLITDPKGKEVLGYILQAVH